MTKIVIDRLGERKRFNHLCDAREFIQNVAIEYLENAFHKLTWGYSGNNYSEEAEFTLMLQEDEELFEEEGKISFDWHSDTEFTEKQSTRLIELQITSADELISTMGYNIQLESNTKELIIKQMSATAFIDKKIPMPEYLYEYYSQPYHTNNYYRWVRGRDVYTKKQFNDTQEYSMYIQQQIMNFVRIYHDFELISPKSATSTVVMLKANGVEKCVWDSQILVRKIASSIVKNEIKSFGDIQLRFNSNMDKAKFMHEFPIIMKRLNDYFFEVK